MLVLTRRPGQEILIGQDIVIRIVKFSDDGRQVRIGIEAPPDAVILRPDAKSKEPRDR